MSYYWISSYPHNIGDIILPGNWGNLVKNTPNHHWLHMENQFETMRLTINPQLPSRLACAFVFEDLDTARLLQSKRTNDIIYEVELLDVEKPIYRADMALIHPNLEQWDAHIGNPKKYWSNNYNEKVNWPEILTLSRFKVISLI